MFLPVHYIVYIETGTSTASYTRNDWQFAIGVERIFSIKHFNFYGGTEIEVIIRGDGDGSSSIIVDTNNSYAANNSTTGVYDNGWSMGLGFFLGFNFNYKFISIGPEVSLAFMYNKYGGDYQESFYESQNTPQNSSIDFKGYEVIKWQMSPVVGSINLSVNF
jgi:hypothetical protein